jgi:hypothetical protein
MEIHEFLHGFFRTDLLYQLQIYRVEQGGNDLLPRCRLFLCFDYIGFEVEVRERDIARVFRAGILFDDLVCGDVLLLLQLLLHNDRNLCQQDYMGCILSISS